MIVGSSDAKAPAQELEVTVKSAQGLREASHAGTTDPYCVVEVLGSQSRFQTKTLQRTVNPVWEETGTLIVARNGVVKVTIYDFDNALQDEVLGSVEIPSTSFADGSFEGRLPLQDAQAKGQASLQVGLRVLRNVQAPNSGSTARSSEGGAAALAVPPTLLQAFPDLAMVMPDPFSLTTVPRTVKPEERRPSSQEEAQHLLEAYHRLLDQLLAAQESIEMDQERMAWGLLQAKQANPPDDFLDMQVFLFLDGLELRIRDFEEGCYKLSLAERRLSRCLDDLESQLELEAVQQSGLVDEVLASRLVEQRRVIQLQQVELDQLHFEHQVLAEEAARLREEVMVTISGAMPEEEEFGVSFADAPDSPQASERGRSAASPASAFSPADLKLL